MTALRFYLGTRKSWLLTSPWSINERKNQTGLQNDMGTARDLTLHAVAVKGREEPDAGIPPRRRRR